MRRYLPTIYLAVNVACALAVFYAAHRVTAVIAHEHRTASDSVDGITFVVYSAPAMVIALRRMPPGSSRSPRIFGVAEGAERSYGLDAL